MAGRIKVSPKEHRTMDGVIFASKREMVRYCELKTQYRAGFISDLELQPRFPIFLNGHKVCTYIADFKYEKGVETIIEDVKGMKTEIYRLKRKLFEACYPGLKITET